MQRADAGERADDGGAVAVRAVVAGGAGQLVDAVADALGVERVASGSGLSAYVTPAQVWPGTSWVKGNALSPPVAVLPA